MRKLFVSIICELPSLHLFAWSIISGILGTAILTGFFSGIMSLDTLSMLLPLIAGGNAAISGYMLIERAGSDMGFKKSGPATVGMLVALLASATINAFCFKLDGFFLLSGTQVLITIIFGTIGAWAGGVLADKYRTLKMQTTG